MNIRFVNHASFIIEHAGKKIMCDPWLEGMVFLNSWKLYAPTIFKYEEFADIDYIWFSHEHPDHFYPPNIKKIAPEHKKNITVLYQDTIDKRVSDYCIHAGFKEVVELKRNTFFNVAPGLDMMCEHFEEGDSWVCFKTKDLTILNLNDCGVANKSDIDKILAKTGKVDILMTQFSYAFWAGNPEDVELRKSIAVDKLEMVKSQVNFIQPKVVIPIASYVYFCHTDNKYLNDSINTAEYTCKFLKENTSAEPVILYNNETYQYPEKHDTAASIKKYQEALANTLKAPDAFVTKIDTVSVDELTAAADKFIEDLNKNNSFIIKSALKESFIYITDWAATYSLSLNGFKKAGDGVKPDVELSSDQLLWCIKQPFGLDTVQIGGRFRKPKTGNYANFYNLFRVNHLKMRGINPNDVSTIAGIAVRRVLTKLGINQNR